MSEAEKGTSTGTPATGVPVSSTPQDAPDTTKDEADFVLAAMDALGREGDEEAGVTSPSVPTAGPPSSTSLASSPESVPQAQTQQVPPVQPGPVVPPSPASVPGQQPAAPPTAQATPQPPQPNGQQQPEAQPTQQPATSGTPGDSPEEGFKKLANEIEANKQKIIDIIAANAYKLSEDEALAIQTEPEKAIPALAARVHVNAVQGVLQHVAQQIPAVVNGILQARERYSELENQFYAQWPQLDKAKHGKEVLQLAAAYRQLHPTAEFAEVSRVVGAQAIVMLGLHPGATAPVQPKPPAQVPFSPAMGRAAAVPTAQPTSNPYELWNQMLEMDERGELDD